MRIPTLLLVLWLALAFGCGSGAPEDPGQEEEPAAEEPAEEEPGGGPPAGDPFTPDRIVAVGRSDDNRDGHYALHAWTWNDRRFDLLRDLPFQSHVEDYVVARSRQEFAARVVNVDTGDEAVYAGSLGVRDARALTPAGLSRIESLLFSRDSRWLAFTAIKDGTRQLWTQDRTTTDPAQPVAEARVGVLRTALGFTFRQGNALHLWRYGGLSPELLSLAGDPSILARAAVSRDGQTLVYSQGPLFAVDLSAKTAGPPVEVSTEAGTTGEVRGDQVRFDGTGLRVLFSREVEATGGIGLVLADVRVPNSAQVVLSPTTGDVVDFGFSRGGDSFFAKVGQGQLHFGSTAAPTQLRLVVDTGFVAGARISHDGNWLGFTAAETLTGKPRLTMAHLSGAPLLLEFQDINGHAPWDFLKGSLPGAPAGTPIAWGAKIGTDLVLKTGTLLEPVIAGDPPAFRAGIDRDLHDWGFISSLAFRYGLWDGSEDPTRAVVVEQKFHDLVLTSFGNEPGGAYFTPRFAGFRAGVSYLGRTTGTALAPELTATGTGAQALMRFDYTGVGAPYDGTTYSKNIGLTIGGDGTTHLFEWADGPFAILQHSDGFFELSPPTIDLDEEGTDGVYVAETAGPVTDAASFVTSGPTWTYYPRGTGEPTHFDINITYGFR